MGTWENWYDGQKFMSNYTQWTDIYGGTHGQFGAYYNNENEDDEKETPLIPPEVQWDFIVASIASVATRMGYPITTTTTTASMYPSSDADNSTKDDDNYDTEMNYFMSSSASAASSNNNNI